MQEIKNGIDRTHLNCLTMQKRSFLVVTMFLIGMFLTGMYAQTITVTGSVIDKEWAIL